TKARPAPIPARFPRSRCYPLKRRKIEMTLALAALQLVLLAVIVILLLRRREAKDESRLALDLSAQFARLETRLAAVDEHLRSSVAQQRTEASAEAQAGREAAERSAAALRSEVMGSVQALGE